MDEVENMTKKIRSKERLMNGYEQLLEQLFRKNGTQKRVGTFLIMTKINFIFDQHDLKPY